MESHISSGRSQSRSPGHHLVHGAVLVFLAEALLPLTGIVTASFLTRSLGAADYGLLTLSATLISWIEFATVSLFARATVKVVSDAKDWRPIGAAVLRLHLLVSIGAMVGCLALARPCAALLGEPELAGYLMLFAVDLPIFALANCHRNILIGRGNYAERARIGAGRWIARLILIVLLVEMGLSVNGAILGSIGASLVELAVARHYVRPSWSAPAAAPAPVWDYAVPIFLATLTLRLLGLGLFLLKILGASAADAGIYGAAQNVSFVMPGVLAVSLSPLLLSTMARVIREGDMQAASILGRNAIRTVVAMLPLAVVAAAASDEIAILLFGADFIGAGPLLAVLVFAGLAMMMMNLVSAILIACGKPSWTLKLAAPLLPVAVAGHLVAIPRLGAFGAAMVTAAVTCVGAFAGVLIACKRLQIKPPIGTLTRGVLLSLIAYAPVYFWPAHGITAIGEMIAGAVMVIGGFVVLGEFRRAEIDFLLSIIHQGLRKRPSPTRTGA